MSDLSKAIELLERSLDAISDMAIVSLHTDREKLNYHKVELYKYRDEVKQFLTTQ